MNYARFLFDDGQADRAREVLGALWTEHPADPRVYPDVGDLLVDQDDLREADRWLTAGATRRSGGVIRDSEQLATDPSLAESLEARAQVQ
ncbi:hypothetical protein FG385_11655 [Amycolatopsis alkalitolerans]|uniref:Tetratricopeptide repeat protein n=1 Tax=Amycolatopsis alkalitolerans TaxID=2547244 RepID=A0A5C4M4V2_9PSEU|nr:hypothetical protein FG385_11655 [Amycolatopsis alkalitolerans]